MVQGMAFLSKKGFNPHNNANRKQVWEAQQHSKQEKERLRKRQEQLKREQEDAELELATRGEIGGSQAQLRFMYDAPPGMEKKNKSDDAYNNDNNGAVGSQNGADDLAQVKPGDDAAAVAFRQMLAASASNSGGGNEGHAADGEGGNDQAQPKEAFKFTPSLQGSMVEADSRYNNSGDNQTDADGNNNKPNNKAQLKDSRSALEKEVGRKNRSTQNNLSYEQQIERFPQLKNAPMAVKRGGATGDDAESGPMMVHFKPLGSQILHVRCLACGVWGHAKGDRECKKSGWNPFALPSTSAAKGSSQHPGSASKSHASSSIMPSRSGDSVERNRSSRSRNHRESPSPDNRRRRRRHRERYDSDSYDSYRRKHSRKHRRHHNESDDDDDDRSNDNDSSSPRRDRHRSKHRKHRYKEHYNNDSSNSDPSSEDSSKLKRRNDDRYDSSEDDERRRRRKDYRSKHSSRDRSRDRKKRSRSKRYESSSSSHKKKKKRRRHSTP